MKILLDHSTPRPLLHYLSRHHCSTAAEQGWERLANGRLLQMAEDEGLDVLITCDRNLRYQQNLSSRKLAILELTTNYWAAIAAGIQLVQACVDAATLGTYAVAEIPAIPKPRETRR